MSLFWGYAQGWPSPQALLKHRLVPPLLHALFPIMAAEPPVGQLDPEDQDSDDDDLEIGLMGETPKHFAVQVIYWPYHCDQMPQRNPLRGRSGFYGFGDFHLLWWERNSQTVVQAMATRKQSRTVHITDRK